MILTGVAEGGTKHTMLQKLLMWEAFGIVFPLLLLIASAFFWRSSMKAGGVIARRLGLTGSIGLGLVSAALLIGAIAYKFEASRERQSFPMPGVLVDVGGYRIHVYCEGEAAQGHPTLVWISGGYGAGLYSFHLQQAWTARGGRSCIIDRAGTGWSELGPEPRSIKQTSIEFEKAMSGAEEKGPFVLVGHSLGGIVAANWAARSQLDISAIVALDPTPQAMIAAGGHARSGGWCGAPDPSLRMALSLFGAGTLFPSLHPMNSQGWKDRNKSLEPVRQILKYFESRPRTMVVSANGFENVCNGGYEEIRTPGALGDLPVLAIVQSFSPDAQQRENAERWSGIRDDKDWENYVAIQKASQQEYPGFSSRGQLILLPPDFGHNFPIEQPDYTIEQVRGFVETLSLEPASERPATDELPQGGNGQ